LEVAVLVLLVAPQELAETADRHQHLVLPHLVAVAVDSGGMLHEQELLAAVVETKTVETTKAQTAQPAKVTVEVTAPRTTVVFQTQVQLAAAVALPQ
jgi:hypothetical protein